MDDEANIRRMLGALLREEGFTVAEAPNGNAALLQVDEVDPDVILLDLLMPPGPDGLETLARLRERGRATPVIMMSGKAQLTDAVRAVKLGAFQFLEKPLTPEVGAGDGSRRAGAQPHPRARTVRSMPSWRRARPRSARAPAMQQVRALIARVGPTEARVLITGESGTGKELVAAAVHAASRRSGRPFVTVNCAAIPRDLVESEMFGHERGAFTGATERRLGRFELAHGGTLFLDEIGDLSAEAQAKLLRTLETGELQRIGAESTTRWTCESSSATNRQLDDEVADGISGRTSTSVSTSSPSTSLPCGSGWTTFPRWYPTWRSGYGPRHAVTFTAAALEALASYCWPGNMRELANLVERLSILSGPMVDAAAVRQVLRGGAPGAAAARRRWAGRSRTRSTTTSAPSSRPR